MHSNRREISNAVQGEVHRYLNDISDDDDAIQVNLKLNAQQLTVIINKILIAIPDDCLIHQNKIDDLNQYIAKEFILFQAHEDLNDPYYGESLLMFIEQLIKDIYEDFNSQT